MKTWPEIFDSMSKRYLKYFNDIKTNCLKYHIIVLFLYLFMDYINLKDLTNETMIDYIRFFSSSLNILITSLLLYIVAPLILMIRDIYTVIANDVELANTKLKDEKKGLIISIINTELNKVKSQYNLIENKINLPKDYVFKIIYVANNNFSILTSDLVNSLEFYDDVIVIDDVKGINADNKIKGFLTDFEGEIIKQNVNTYKYEMRYNVTNK